MTDEINNEPKEATEKGPSMEQQLEQRDAIIADLQAQFSAVKGKSDELLSEAKMAKQKARDAAESRERAKLDKARQEGDFEQLLKSSESERNNLNEQLNSLRTNISTEKVRSQAMQIAAELADGANAELLSEFVQKRIKYTDDGTIKVLDQNGDLTVSSLEDLKNEFTNNERYKALIRGTKSSGGGAPGSTASSASNTSKVKTIDRATFDTMSHPDRAAFFKDGGKMVDFL